jgi:hypothetical protein
MGTGKTTRRLLLGAALAAAPRLLSGAGLPVTAGHPRLLLTQEKRVFLQSKVSSADPSWIALRQRADLLTGYAINPYVYSRRTDEPDNTIFYDYQGQGWFDAALPLGFAYQMTGNAVYANKLLALADEMVRAQNDPSNNPPYGLPPIEPDDYYPTRYVGPVLAFIYDWCHEALGAVRQAQMVALMNAYFDDLRANAYQRNDHADGNYFFSHAYCAAAMGYASFGDNPRAQEMIDYARARFDGSASPLLAADNVPSDYFSQLFEGGYPPEIARDFNGPAITAAPYRGGFLLQGWAYGSGTLDRVIDYMLFVESATGERLSALHADWISQVWKAEKESMAPNRFEIDPVGDWGGDYGAAVLHGLPLRLATVLAGTPDGPGAQHFAASELAAASPYADFPDEIYQSAYQPAPWEAFFFDDASRPSEELSLPPFYSGFAPGTGAGSSNGAMPYFVMRSDWSSSATWASASMGAAWYDDHQHFNAGHIYIRRGDDALLVDAASWMPEGDHGIVGSSTEENTAAAANTLFVDDYGDFQNTGEQYLGGQGAWGRDEVVAAEQNDGGTYVRCDLTSAYDNGGDPAAQVGRRLDHFYRSFLYLRSAGVFVVFDQVRAEASSNARGPYRKQLRWHFPQAPEVSGRTAAVVRGSSRLQLDTLLPADASIAVVDESANPDSAIAPCDNPCNSKTWRLEVGGPAQALEVPFLTVLSAGAAADPSMITAALVSPDGLLTGASITAAGQTNVVYFNAQPGQSPAPLTSATFSASITSVAAYTICGVIPGARYRWSASAATVTVTQDAAGDLVASPAGVLRYAAGSGREVVLVPRRERAPRTVTR